MTTAFKIESNGLNLADLLKDFYSVPDFQREYVWQEENVRKLLDDVYSELYDEQNKRISGLEYFIGSIVVYRDEQGTFQLIDGQQRLTTIYLLLCVIRDVLIGLGEKPTDTLRIQISANAGDPRTGLDVFRHRLNLQYEDSSGILDAIAKHKETTSDIATSLLADKTKTSVKNILMAYQAIEEFLRVNFLDNAEAVRGFHAAFTNEVKLIRIITPDLTHALKIFETINDRGVGLNAMDLLKNLLFMRTPHHDQNTLKTRWKALVDALDKCREKPLRFLRYYVMAFHDTDTTKPLREDDIYQYFVTHADELGITRDPLGFAQQLLDRARNYAHFVARQDQHGTRNRYLENIALLSGQARQHFILLLSGHHLAPPLFNELSRHLENLYFCYLITREPTKTFERTFALWAKDLRAVKTKEELNQFVDRHIRADIRSRSNAFDFAFRELSLDRIQVYRMRYILAKLTQFIEERISASSADERLDSYWVGAADIEHILPANPRADVRAAFDRPHEYDKYINRLGNLALLEKTINASVSNGSYTNKKAGYLQSRFRLTRSLVQRPHVGQNTQLNRAVADLIEFDVWDSAAIERRQEMLGRLARQVWLEDGNPAAPGGGAQVSASPG